MKIKVLYHCRRSTCPNDIVSTRPRRDWRRPAVSPPQASPAQVFGKLISGQEEEIVAAAEAMPADKYNFAPTNGEFKGVRTFGQQLTHIAEAQYFFFGGFGTKPTIDSEIARQANQQRRNRESS